MQIYEKHIPKDPRLPFIFKERVYPPHHNTQGEGANWHENLEILFVREGKGIIRVNERNVSVSSGDAVIVNSNMLHSVASVDALFYQFLIVDRAFCLANHFDTSKLHFKTHVHDGVLLELVDKLSAEYGKLSDDEFAVQAIRATVLEIMTLICRKYSSQIEEAYADNNIIAAIKKALGFINSEYSRDISLDEIANFAGLSKFYFAHEFRKITGYTFVEYVNIVRCEKAKRLLSDPSKSINAVCEECGFSNQSYFTRTFKKYAGMLPKEFRKS